MEEGERLCDLIAEVSFAIPRWQPEPRC